VNGDPHSLAAVRQAWICYLACVLALAVGVRLVDDRVALAGFLAVHGALLGVALLLRADGRHARAAWSAFTLCGLPAVFSAVGLGLPDLHPQPYEWCWIAFDRWLLGTDPTVAVQAWLRPWSTELLQLAYATFYFLPIAVLVTLLRAGRHAAYDRCLCAVAVGFLLSYLGYYLFPTLPPYRYLEHGAPLRGLALAESVHGLLDTLEFNRFDCMPSGHTMLTLVTLALAWRYTPGLALVLTPLGVLLIAATVALRYHYVADVLAGAVLAPLALLAARFIAGGAGGRAAPGPGTR